MDAAAATQGSTAATPGDGKDNEPPSEMDGDLGRPGAAVAGSADAAKGAETASLQPPTSRTVKMYRNAAREYGRGCSAGQAMWM